MSSFLKNTKNPKTGKYEPAAWVDDKYGNHNYGVLFLDGQWYNPQNVDLYTKPTRVKAVWDDFFPQPKQQEHGSDLAAKGFADSEDLHESAQGTIEDKLRDIRIKHGIPGNKAWKELSESIRWAITTETTKALQELSNKSETHETPIYGVTNRQICEAIDALQKEQK